MARCRTFPELFTVGKLRTTEVAVMLAVDRVTVSRWKSHGHENCRDTVGIKIGNLIAIVDIALRNGTLPLNKDEIVGKESRLKHLRQILLTASKSRSKE